jgi:hypothetical protein
VAISLLVRLSSIRAWIRWISSGVYRRPKSSHISGFRYINLTYFHLKTPIISYFTSNTYYVTCDTIVLVYLVLF